MNNLKAFMESMERKEVLLPALQSWLTRVYVRAQEDPAVIARGIRHDAELTARTFQRRRQEYNHQDDGATKHYFHPSRIGGCPRAMAYGAFGAPSNRTPIGKELLRSHLVFEVGTYFHVLFQNLCSRAGLLLKREVHVQDDIHRIVGHGDGILRLPTGKALLEIKTINGRGFLQLTAPKPEHVEQATLYMGILRLKLAVFIYYCKETGGLKEFKVSYSEGKYDGLIDRIEKTRGAIRSLILPSREGRTANKYPCTFCPFSRVCFDSAVGEKFLAKSKVKDTDKGKL